ncbi:MAG: ribonuclease H [Patescibacteria group bacterium]
MNKETEQLLFTDGSSLGNPGPGGWGAVVVSENDSGDPKGVVELGGRENKTTNNRMELTALIQGLSLVLKGEALNDLTIYIDSAYVHKGATVWSKSWQENGWWTKAKKNVENRDLWEKLLSLLEEQKKSGKIIWKHIPGHSGIPGNVRADAIATGFAKKEDVELFEGDLADYTVDIFNTRIDQKVAEKRSASRAHSRAKAYSYLSLVVGKVMRHTTWADCEKRVKGKAEAKYKKALSSLDESAIRASWGVSL